MDQASCSSQRPGPRPQIRKLSPSELKTLVPASTCEERPFPFIKKALTSFPFSLK